MSARLAVSTSSESSTDDGSETDEEDLPYLTFVDPVVPDFVPKMSDLLNVKYSNADQNTIFETAEAANRLVGADPAPKDNTLPRTQAQRRAFVKAVFNAVKSTEHAEDNPGMIRPFAEGKYSDRRIEVLAWNILHTCVVRHTTGALLAPFDVKKKGTTELSTFADRMAKVIECLTVRAPEAIRLMVQKTDLHLSRPRKRSANTCSTLTTCSSLSTIRSPLRSVSLRTRTSTNAKAIS